MARHGPMVLAVCRSLLRDPNDVDDAVQATFLVLVRKAETLRRRDLLGGWLHAVANRVARRARYVAGRRKDVESRRPESLGTAQRRSRSARPPLGRPRRGRPPPRVVSRGGDPLRPPGPDPRGGGARAGLAGGDGQGPARSRPGPAPRPARPPGPGADVRGVAPPARRRGPRGGLVGPARIDGRDGLDSRGRPARDGRNCIDEGARTDPGSPDDHDHDDREAQARRDAPRRRRPRRPGSLGLSGGGGTARSPDAKRRDRGSRGTAGPSRNLRAGGLVLGRGADEARDPGPRGLEGAAQRGRESPRSQ